MNIFTISSEKGKFFILESEIQDTAVHIFYIFSIFESIEIDQNQKIFIPEEFY